MAALIDKDREPSERELRWFGVLFLGFALVIAWLMHARAGRVVLPLLLSLGATLLACVYYAVPGLRRALLRGWVSVTYPLGWLGSHLALAVFFFLVLTPIGLAMRLAGRDPLQRALERDRTSYWLPRRGTANAKRYWNQY
jgi:hypothetical protein